VCESKNVIGAFLDVSSHIAFRQLDIPFNLFPRLACARFITARPSGELGVMKFHTRPRFCHVSSALHPSLFVVSVTRGASASSPVARRTVRARVFVARARVSPPRASRVSRSSRGFVSPPPVRRARGPSARVVVARARVAARRARDVGAIAIARAVASSIASAARR
jgi:hypothetical protein